MFNKATSLSEKRAGRTNIVIPNVGVPRRFDSLRAGDFFMYNGSLQLKINLTEAVDVPNGSDCLIGTNQYESSTTVYVVNATITIS